MRHFPRFFTPQRSDGVENLLISQRCIAMSETRHLQLRRSCSPCRRNSCPLCSVAPPGPIFPGQYRPHDLHCATKADPNLSLGRNAHLKAKPEMVASPATCNLLAGVDYNGHSVTSIHRLEVDFTQPSAESTIPEEVRRVAVTMIV